MYICLASITAKDKKQHSRQDWDRMLGSYDLVKRTLLGLSFPNWDGYSNGPYKLIDLNAWLTGSVTFQKG